MGFIIKDIANITEPASASLSGSPNYVIFESKPHTVKPLEAKIVILSTMGVENLTLTIVDRAGVIRNFMGTTAEDDVSGPTFFVAHSLSDTLENLRASLLLDGWVSSNFEIQIPTEWEGGLPIGGTTLLLKSKGAGLDYNIDITVGSGFSLNWEVHPSILSDSISGEESTVEIEIDIYTSTGCFLGELQREGYLGKFETSLQKTYSGNPVWFNPGGIFRPSFNTPLPGWFNPGTATDYQFIAKIKGVNNYVFYRSDILYSIIGEGVDNLTPYIYGSGGIIKPLTNKPRTEYRRGQRAFFNFILSDPEDKVNSPIPLGLSIRYQAYSQSGTYLGAITDHILERPKATAVNSCSLNIGQVLDKFPTTGLVCVYLARGEDNVSEAVEYAIIPECLHTVTDFAFINKLGGWDAFNFDAPIKNEIKPTIEVYKKAITPFNRTPENVYTADLSDTYTVESTPLSDDVAEWLKELAASKLILNSDGRCVIIEDFALAIAPSSKNMQKVTLKYRLSYE